MNTYFELIAERKKCLFTGDEERAAQLLEEAENLVKQGKVSDNELIAAAYI